jgi:RNA polymerase sigma factor (sigma-70 family)
MAVIFEATAAVLAYNEPPSFVPIRNRSSPHLTSSEPPNPFEKLLRQFSADRDEAGELYEIARRKLIRFFEWRSIGSAEECADEVMERAARRIDEGQKIDNLMAYLFGIARIVYKEKLRERERTPQSLDETRPDLRRSNTPEPIEPDERQLCFDKCLAELSPDNRDLILDYFEGTGGAKIRSRQGIADRLGIPLNALRIRVHRIRKTLEDCIAECLTATFVRND